MPTFDPISGAPISSLGAYLDQSVTQTLSLSDSLSINVDFDRPVEHTISLSDVFGLNTILNQSVDSTISLSDLTDLSVEYLLNVSSTYTLSDDLTVLFVDKTDSIHSLSLSQDVVINVIRLFILEDTLTLEDSALRNLLEEITHTISFSDLLEKVTPEVSLSNTLALSQTVATFLTLNISVSQTYSLSQTLYRLVPKDLQSTLVFSHAIDARNLPYINIVDDLNLVQNTDYITNLDASNYSTIQLTHLVSLVIVPMQSLIQTLSLTQTVDLYNFAQQNVVSDLTLIGEAAYSLFEQQDMLQLLTLSHVIDPRNLAQQNDPNTLTLTHSVSVTVTSTGPKTASNKINLQQSVSLNQVKYFEICQCLDLSHGAYKAIELDVEHTLSLSQNYIPGMPEDTLSLSHVLGINATFDECCGTVFVPDKVVSNSLILTQAVSISQESVPSLSSSLVLSHTAAYYKV